MMYVFFIDIILLGEIKTTVKNFHYKKLYIIGSINRLS